MEETDHISVDDLPTTTFSALNQGEKDSHCASEAASSKIGKKIYRETRFFCSTRKYLSQAG